MKQHYAALKIFVLGLCWLIVNDAYSQFTLTNPSGCNVHLPIFDNGCNVNHQFRINADVVPGHTMGADVYLKEVRLIIFHEWDADLDMRLISPSGISVLLSSDNGGGNDHYGNPLNGLCDEYTTFLSPSSELSCTALSIQDATAPFIGSFLPEGDLSAFNDGSDPQGQWILEICDDGQEHYGFLEYAELVFEGGTCIRPTEIQVLDVDSNSVTLTWQPGSNCGNTILEYGFPGFEPGTGVSPGEGNTIAVNCPPYTISGLSPGTQFEVYLRENCGPGFSANSCVASFSTLCAPPPPTIVTDFDSLQTCDPICGAKCDINGFWFNASNDDFDWLVNSGATSTPNTGPLDDVSGGGNYIYLESSGSACRNGNEAVLQSNCLTVKSSGDTCDLSYYYNMYGVHVNELRLEISVDGGLSWNTLWQALGDQGQGWKRAFVGLSDYDGQLAQLRFVGRGGNGFRGDIALDEIVFYGSIDNGPPTFTLYADADGDGYGNSDIFIKSCQAISLPGFVAQGGDCDDEAPWFNPGVAETPCDGIDFNCNGFIDENDLPPPSANGDTICSGAVAVLTASPAFGGQIYWYDADTAQVAIHQGSQLSLATLPPNNTPTPAEYTYYAEEQTFSGCQSVSRTAVTVVVLPSPAISPLVPLAGCKGATVNLETADLVDANATNPQVLWFDGPPFTSGNEIAPLVTVNGSHEYYALATAQGGCMDTALVNVAELPTPEANIFGESLVCRGDSALLVVSDTGNGLAPVQISWNTGSFNDSIIIEGFGDAGQSAIYSVTLTGANGCTSVDTLEALTITSVDSVMVNVGAVSTCGGSDGSIMLTPLDGIPPYNYSWPGGQAISSAGLTIPGLSQGSYDVTITDSSPAACPFVIPFIVVNGPAAVVNIDGIDPVSCEGGNDGCIQLEVLGNNPTVLWSNGVTTETNCDLSAGTYTVTITEGSCQNILSIEVPEPPALIAKPNAHAVSCNGEYDGTIDLTVFGGTQPYQFAWSNGKITKDIASLPAGLYSVTVTDARGCQFVLTDILVPEPDPVAFAVQAVAEPSCTGLSDGSIDIQPLGGNGFYSVAWSNGASGSQVTNLITGSYYFTITDYKGCAGTGNVALGEPDPVQIFLQGSQNPICKGQSNGYLDIELNGGTAPYTYNWTSGAQVQDLVNIPEGAYQVTVTDANGCSAVSPVYEIVGPELMQLSANVVAPPCEGIENGSIEVSVASGGTAPFAYSWSTDESVEALYNLPSGEYGLTITDAMGCQVDTVFVLPENQPIVASYTVVQPACHGSKTGQICLNLSGGLAPYSILWSTGGQGDCISNLGAANYTAVVADAQGCVLNLPLIPLEEPEEIAIELVTVEGVGCHGEAEGRIDVNVSGGNPPYQYNWSNGRTTEDIGGLPAGTYQLSVTDANNCVRVSTPYVIASPDPINIHADLPAPQPCTATQVDSLCLTVTGGVPGYSYLWNSGDTAACLMFPNSGDYSVTVTDLAGCTAELMSIKVREPYFPLSMELAGSKQLLCAGDSDGFITTAIDGGSKPYQYIWSNGVWGTTVDDTLTISNLPKGNYGLTITDATGCTKAITNIQVKVAQPLVPYIPGELVKHVSCHGGHNGQATAVVTGGTTPYEFVWVDAQGDTVSTSANLDSVMASFYTVYITDSIGCASSISIEILEPENYPSLLVTPPSVKQISCYGANDGSIDIIPIGGVPPYTFVWSNGDSTEDLSNLGAGDYFVTVTDANLCSYQSNAITIIEPDPVVLSNSSVMDVSCYGEKDGSIDVDFTGGTEPYFYDWSLPSANEDLFGLPAGEYHLTMMDTNGCAFDTSFVVNEPAELVLETGETGSLSDTPTGKAWVVPAGGTPPYLYSWNNGATTDTITGIPPGWYEVIVTDANFCISSEWVEVPLFVATGEVDEEQIELLVYPNPASNTVRIQSSDNRQGELELLIFDMAGRQVGPGKHIRMDARNEVDVSTLEPGIYIMIFLKEGLRVAYTRLSIIR